MLQFSPSHISRTTFNAENTCSWMVRINALQEMAVDYRADEQVLWQFMQPKTRPSFTSGLLDDMNMVLDAVQDSWRSGDGNGVQYLVLASAMPGIFNLGGDLNLFRQLILDQERDKLRAYAHACIDVQYRRSTALDLPLCTIALVQGDALGGGFECALAHDVIVAERSAKFGLPEILFNLFPGMGAYSFLARRLTPIQAERFMLSGDIHSAESLHQLGLVDVLAEDGQGEAAVQAYIARHRKTSKSRNAVGRIRRMFNPVSRQELIEITNLWVETALTLDSRDLRKMEHLCVAQNRRWTRLLESGQVAAQPLPSMAAE